MIAAANDRLYAALCEALGAPELAADPRFATNADRVANRAELIPLLEAQTRDQGRADLLERFDRLGVPAAPVQNLAEVVEHPQTKASGMLQPLPHPNVPDAVTVAAPISVDGERVLHRTPAPALGEHTQQILAETGYTDEEIAALAAEGAIAAARD
jgi:crotonobetainyl-CoA:carnitine CoA-transferase CaiB-like acyl-CoA transferase